jgi:hypothetical protein
VPGRSCGARLRHFHRTPFQQRTDLLRDQRHAVEERERLRFTHFQVIKEPDYVAATITAVIRRLEAPAAAGAQ